MMTNADRFSAYLDKLESEGKLSPGDRLPKYNDVAKMFRIPYSSVQRIFKTLEYAGRVKIVNGVGSFLNGGDDLDVDFYVTGSTFELSLFQGIVNEISSKNDLHLRFTVKSKAEGFQSKVQDHRVVITESDPWIRMDGCLMDYSFFADYDAVMSQFRNLERSGNMNIQLPFYLFTYQGAVNKKLLKAMDRQLDHLSDLSDWDDLARQAQAHGAYPAALSSLNHSLWNFPLYNLSLLLMIQERPDAEQLFKVPFYTHPIGKRILTMASDCLRTKSTEREFAARHSVMEFMMGSWFPFQAQQKFAMESDSFNIVPLMRGSRHLLPYNEVYLKTFANPSITQNERERVWRFLKLLLSKQYQKRLTGISGMVSPRCDMKPEDHQWLKREDYLHYFPSADTLLLNRDILPLEKLSVLSSLYELYEQSDISEDQIASMMDSVLIKDVFLP